MAIENVAITKVYLNVSNKKYPLSGVRVNYQLNQLPVAEAWPVMGLKLKDQSKASKDSGRAFQDLLYKPATLHATIGGVDYTLMEGRVIGITISSNIGQGGLSLTIAHTVGLIGQLPVTGRFFMHGKTTDLITHDSFKKENLCVGYNDQLKQNAGGATLLQKPAEWIVNFLKEVQQSEQRLARVEGATIEDKIALQILESNIITDPGGGANTFLEVFANIVTKGQADLIQSLINAWAGSTSLSLLLSYITARGLVGSFTKDKLVILPHFGIMKQEAITIKAGDVLAASTRRSAEPFKIHGVAMHLPRSTGADEVAPDAKIPSIGIYPPSKEDETCGYIYVPPPPWAVLVTQQNIGPSSTEVGISTTATPSKEQTPTKAQARNQQGTSTQTQKDMEQWQEAILKGEYGRWLWKHESGGLSVKFNPRYMPGQRIKLDVGADNKNTFLGTEVLHALIESVTISFTSGQFSQELGLSHIRPASDNDKYAFDTHPLFPQAQTSILNGNTKNLFNW
jgi:hypothetical protein